jgi:hypothetical protein
MVWAIRQRVDHLGYLPLALVVVDFSEISASGGISAHAN